MLKELLSSLLLDILSQLLLLNLIYLEGEEAKGLLHRQSTSNRTVRPTDNGFLVQWAEIQTLPVNRLLPSAFLLSVHQGYFLGNKTGASLKYTTKLLKA